MSQAGWLLCGKLSSICAEGTPEKVSEGEARCSQSGGTNREPGKRRGDQLCFWLQMPPYSPRHQGDPACAAAAAGG